MRTFNEQTNKNHRSDCHSVGLRRGCVGTHSECPTGDNRALLRSVVHGDVPRSLMADRPAVQLFFVQSQSGTSLKAQQWPLLAKHERIVKEASRLFREQDLRT
jgi:hypothetical protein